MRRRWIIAGAFGLIAAAFVAAMMWPKGKEPVYEGKKLSEWLMLAQSNTAGSFIGDKENEKFNSYRKAISHIGTNALPFFLKWIQFERSAPRDKLERAYKKLPAWLQLRCIDGALDQNSYEWRARQAAFAFGILGNDAWPAVPTLNRLAHGARAKQSLTTSNAQRALDALKVRSLFRDWTRAGDLQA